jgi:hypothetical protein
MFRAFTIIGLLVLGLKQRGRLVFVRRKVRKCPRNVRTFSLQMLPLLNAHRVICMEPSYCCNDFLDLHHSVVLTTCLAAAKHVQINWHIKKMAEQVSLTKNYQHAVNHRRAKYISVLC